MGEICITVEPVLKDHAVGHKNMVSQDRWSLVTGSVALKYGTLLLTTLTSGPNFCMIVAENAAPANNRR